MLLSRKDLALYKSMSARINHLAVDRCDLQNSAKELCRVMSAPTGADKVRLKPSRAVHAPPTTFEWQDEGAEIHTFTNSDWAGCRRTRRSTSGGIMLRGRYLTRSNSKRQATVSLCSARGRAPGRCQSGRGDALDTWNGRGRDRLRERPFARMPRLPSAWWRGWELAWSGAWTCVSFGYSSGRKSNISTTKRCWAARTPQMP